MNINKNIKKASIGMILGLGVIFGASDVEAQSIKVQKGNTLFQIAKQNGTTVAKLKELNNLKSNTIYVGQTIVIKPTESKTSVKTTTANTATANTATANTATANTATANTATANTATANTATVKTTTTTTAQAKKTTVSKGTAVVNEAKKYIGVKYVWGGQTTKGFDCSGYISYVLKKQGKIKNRGTTASFWSQSKKIKSPEVGDLIFFQNTYRKGVSHMGIYIGNGKFIHASTSDGVTITSVSDKYWKTKFLGYGRI